MVKVSIIVPCYNQAKYLPECLDSVLSQTLQDWECIIVNDGSSDNTEDVALQYTNQDTRFKYVFQSNSGPSAARNRGILHSCGKYLLPLDADDWISDSYIEKASAYLDNHNDVKLVYCKAVQFNEKKQKEWNSVEYKYENFIWDNSIFCTAMFRKKDCDNIGGYSVNIKDGLEDWDFFLRLLHRDDCVYRINEHLFHYRKGENSIVTKKVINNKKESMLQLCRNNLMIYQPYLDNILYWRYMAKKGELYNEILQSHSYRLGHFILYPFILLKRLLKKSK